MRRYLLPIGIAAAGLAAIAVAVAVVLVFVLDGPIRIPFFGRATRTPEERLAELEPLSPVVADRLPQRGVELMTDGNMDIFFDQPMDQTATVNAFRIEPPVAGGFVWLDGETLRFTPTQPLERATRYTVTIDERAISASGLALPEPVTLDFQTVGFLEVSQVVPAPGADAIEPQSVITMMFNRPVVPLLIAEEQAGLPQPLVLDPPVAGTGEWINTSIYQFKPEVALAGGVTYQANIAPGLEDTTGGLMVEGFSWDFTTLPPGIVEVSPTSGSNDIPLDEEIRITFNQPMDPASAQAALVVQALSGAGGVASGQYSWEENTLIFKPSSLLALGTPYAVRLNQGALSASRQTGLVQPFDWSFNTVAPPAVVGTTPFNGEQAASPSRFLQIQFASPMDEDTFENRVIITPAPPDDTESFYNEFDRSLNFFFELQPSTDYTVEILPGMADPHGNITNQRLLINFRTAQAEPQIWLNVPDRVGFYNGANDTELFAVHRNVSRLDLALYSLNVNSFASLTGPEGFRIWDEFQPGLAGNLLRNWSVEAAGELNELTYGRLPLVSDEGGSLPPGVYMLEVDAPEVAPHFRTRHLMIVASANLTFKGADDEALVWLTDLQSGQPMPGKTVTFYDENFSTIGQSLTDANGIVQVALPRLDELFRQRYALVQDGGTFAAALSDWDRGIEGYQFDLPFTFSPQNSTIYLYTDRPLYRPGQEVSFKGIVRNVDGATYSIPNLSNVPVRVFNAQGDMISEQVLPLSPFGTFNGQLTLDEEGTIGFHRIEAEINGETRGLGFQVAEYRKPEFQVSLIPAAEQVAQGDTIQVQGEATFFFGGPVSDAEVEWTALADSFFFDYTGPGRWSFSDLNVDDDEQPFVPGFGRVVTEGTATTDAQGRFGIQLPADLGDRVSSSTFTIEAVITDIDQQQVANRTEIIVHPADFLIGLQPENFVSVAGGEQTVNVLTVDWDSQPVGRQALDVQVVERRWNSVREENELGQRVWTYSVEEIPVDTFSVTSDADGEASITFTPPSGGIYRVRAVGRDGAGREVASSTFVWASSSTFVAWRQPNNDRIDLIADRSTYSPGDTAEILIQSPFQGAVQALITIEREGILQHEVIILNTNSHIYRLPISSDLAPNVFVSVMLLKGVDAANPVPAFKVGMVKLDVDPNQQTIIVEATPDREQVGPGEEVTYEIRTTNHNGQPVSAEISLSLADLAALSLAPPNSSSILDHFYGNMPLAVRTSTSLTLLVDRLNQDLFAQGKGGGGGGGEDAFFEVRGDFRDTAFWRANVVTDERGRASVTIKLPDNLTTWRMDARAVTADTLVGDTIVDTIASKDLLVRPVTPRFFVVDDEVRLSAVIHNNTERDINNVRVELEADGVELVDRANAMQRVDVGTGQRVEVFWDVVAQDVDTVDLTFSARGGGLDDASKPTLAQPPDQLLPTLRFEAPETVGTAGILDRALTRVEAIVLPRTFEVTQGELAVELAPSLAASMTDSLDFLEHYPCECTEVTVSRFLPNVLTARALSQLGVQDAQLEADLNEVVNQALQRLYSQQHVDGGWGWWVQDDSHPTVSAWVVLGMVEAQASGFQVSETALQHAIEYLRSQLQPLDALSQREALNQQAFTLFVLAKAGQPDVSRSMQLFDSRQSLDHYARAYLAQTLWMIDASDTRITNILSDLNNAALASATGVHWEETNSDFRNWSTNTRTTAIILDTLIRTDSANVLNPNAVRWLMSARQAGHWQTTQETAWSLIALTDWMVTQGELQAEYAFDLTLNGDELVSGTADQSTLRQPTNLTVGIEQFARRQANQLAITRGEGPGNLYYSAHLTVGLPVQEIQPLSRGLIVSRQYYLAEDEDQRPIDTAQAGQEIGVKLTIIAPNDLHFVIVEDPLPAGAETVDTTLLTTSVLGQPPELNPANPLSRGWGWWYFSKTQLRDEKVVLSASFLPSGTYEYTYTMRASLPGTYRVLPPTGSQFYFPEVSGRGAGSLFTITP